jgi:hypothetical protein
LILEENMADSAERIKILKMIEALSKGDRKREATPATEAKWMRVRVTDLDTGKTSVNVNLPIGLVNVGLRMGARFVPDMEGYEIEEISEALRQGLTGKIVDIVDEDEGQRVEIYVE